MAPATVNGVEWLQPVDFVNLSWNDINTVCDATSGFCNGSLNGNDITGWTWASLDDANGLFNYFLERSLSSIEFEQVGRGLGSLGPGVDFYQFNNPMRAEAAYNTFFVEGGFLPTLEFTFTDSSRQVMLNGWLRSPCQELCDPSDPEYYHQAARVQTVIGPSSEYSSFAYATNGEYAGQQSTLGAWFYAPVGTYADPPTVVLPDETTTPDPVGEIPPGATPEQTFTFNAPEPGNWFDPVAADAYLYELLGGGEFLDVRGVPGYQNLQIAWGEGYASILDLDLDPGESYFFGPGVTSFMLSGFTPSFDASDPTAIPTWLDFSGSPTELRMTALSLNGSAEVSLPATFPLLGLGLVALGFTRRKWFLLSAMNSL